MKNNSFILFAFLFTVLSLSSCVKNQNANSAYAVDSTVDTSSVSTQDQIINNTNYQQQLRNQTARAQAAGIAHGGGGRR